MILSKFFHPETAYQITSMLEGAVQRGTGKGLRDLKFRHCWQNWHN